MNADEKGKFRQRKAWTQFRAQMRKERKKDPITGQPLAKKYNLHHCDFAEDAYDKLVPENFECLNNMSHDVVHFFFGVPGRIKKWRPMVLRLIQVLKKMERLNSKNGENL